MRFLQTIRKQISGTVLIQRKLKIKQQFLIDDRLYVTLVAHKTFSSQWKSGSISGAYTAFPKTEQQREVRQTWLAVETRLTCRIPRTVKNF